MADRFANSETLRVTISPEGTRGKAHFWRTGFYYIASTAQVPIVLGYVDYKTKVVGLGPKLFPSGDIIKDMDIIRDFYAGVTPKYPEKQGAIKLRVELEAEAEQPPQQ